MDSILFCFSTAFLITAYQFCNHLVIGVIAKLPEAELTLSQVFLFHLKTDFFSHFAEHVPQMKSCLNGTKLFLCIS